MANLFLRTLDLWLARSESDVCADGARELELAIFSDGWDDGEGDTTQTPTPQTQRSRPGVCETPDGCARTPTDTSNEAISEANEPLRA